MTIACEKQLERYRRDRKRNLIERDNPVWNDLSIALGIARPLRPAPRWTPEQGSPEIVEGFGVTTTAALAQLRTSI